MKAWWKKIRLMYDVDKDFFFYGPDAAKVNKWKFHHGAPPLYLSLGVFV
jgi:hypothetical protein